MWLPTSRVRGIRPLQSQHSQFAHTGKCHASTGELFRTTKTAVQYHRGLLFSQLHRLGMQSCLRYPHQRRLRNHLQISVEEIPNGAGSIMVTKKQLQYPVKSTGCWLVRCACDCVKLRLSVAVAARNVSSWARANPQHLSFS